MPVHADWWKILSIARIVKCLTGKWATHTVDCATAEFPRCAYFAVTSVYLLPEIVITSKAYHQVLSCRCIRHQYDTFFPAVGRAWVAVRKMFWFILHI